jgi:plasmid maintenance system killer protein
VELHISDKSLRRALEDGALERRYGTDMAKKLALRLAALRAARSLGDLWPPKSGPERCHELKGNRKDAFSVDLKQPYRLLFRPIEAEAPADRSNEQHRWQSIISIDIFAIEDTHE